MGVAEAADDGRGDGRVDGGLNRGHAAYDVGAHVLVKQAQPAVLDEDGEHLVKAAEVEADVDHAPWRVVLEHLAAQRLRRTHS